MWVNPVPWVAEARAGADTWGGFPDERRELADHIADNGIDDLLRVSCDTHMVAIGDIGVVVGAVTMLWASGHARHGATVLLAVLLEFSTFLVVGAVIDRTRPDVEALGSVPSPPASIVVASGDIHLSYAARVEQFADSPRPEVWQVVSSPIRNALIPHERGAMRFAITRTGGVVGTVLRVARSGRVRRPTGTTPRRRPERHPGASVSRP